MQNGSRFFASLWSRAYVLLTFTALFWAGNAIVARAARELVPPVALAFWRWTIALAIILPFAWRHLRRDAPVIRGNWRMLLVLGALGIGAFNTLLYSGLQQTTALNAMLLQSGQPALILFLGAIFMGDSTTVRQIVGAAIALAGVLWIIARGNLGILRLLVGVFWFVSLFLFVRRYEKTIEKFTRGLLTLLGKNSLFVYCLQAFIIYLVDSIISPPEQSNILLNTILGVIFVTILVAATYYKEKVSTYRKRPQL